jgi:serine/threonine protein kinase
MDARYESPSCETEPTRVAVEACPGALLHPDSALEPTLQCLQPENPSPRYGSMESIGTLNLDHLIGHEIGTSVLLKELGRGNMAAIFIAYQRTLKRQIAAKILPKSLLTPFASERFTQEAESAAILSHPNIVTVYETGETNDFLYILMQLVKGKSLADHLRLIKKHVLPSRRVLPVGKTLRIIADVLSALDYAHRQDIVHRDIKPANILIESHTDRPIITDFGLAMTTRAPGEDFFAGTPIYMAPEQMKSGPVDGRADIYATGMMLLEMLGSDLPQRRLTTMEEVLKVKVKVKKHLFRKTPSENNPMLDREMDDILLKALSPDPEGRYATCVEFLEALMSYKDRHAT